MTIGAETAGCLGKIAYETRAMASKVYRSLLAKRGEGGAKMDVYHCARCRKFHLGRKPTLLRKPRDRAENRMKALRYFGLVNR